MDIDWNMLIGILVSMASGAGGAALLDVFIKPRMLRRQTSRLLLAEIRLNTEYLEKTVTTSEESPHTVPIDFFISIQALQNNVILQLVGVDPPILEEVFLLYIRYSELNSYVVSALSIMEDLDRLPIGDPVIEERNDNLKKCVHFYHRFSKRCLNDGHEIAKKLQKIADKKILHLI